MEIELKNQLDPGDVPRLRKHLGSPLRTVLQSNFYFDDRDGTLGQAGWGLRLRREVFQDQDTAARHLLTVKRAGEQQGDYSHRPEFERELHASEFEHLRSAPDDLCVMAAELAQGATIFAGLELQELGAMENLREVYPLDDAELELDETRWPDGTTSFEIEVEVGSAAGQDAAAAALRTLLDSLRIPWTPSVDTKLGRLVALLRRD